jgi:hypothetical protein
MTSSEPEPEDPRRPHVPEPTPEPIVPDQPVRPPDAPPPLPEG